MKTRTLLLSIAFCLAAIATTFAQDTNVGTWKLNEAKSKIPAGVGKNQTVVYTMDGDNYKATVDGVDGSGNAIHNEWTGKFDGKDYPVTGDAMADSRSIKKVDDTHYKIANKKDGKTTLTGEIALSADGKTRTLTTHRMDKGKKMSATYVYEKQ